MHKLKSLFTTNKLSENQLIGLLAIVASLIAWRVALIQQGWINSDTTLYFEQARLFALGEWRAALTLYMWPLYALLIAATKTITGLSIHAAAQLLNVIFYGITSYALSKLIQLAGGDKTTILCGNALLFSCAYISGSVLGMLLRDEGFWAFFLLSLVYFIRFLRGTQFKDALFWQLCCIVAMLFRLEAVTYLLILPLILFTYKQYSTYERLNLIGKVYALPLVLIILSVFAALALNTINLSSFGRIEEIFVAFSGGSGSMYSLFLHKSDIMANAVLGNYLEDFAQAGLALTLLWIVIVKCLMSAGWLPLTLIASQGKQALHLPQHDTQRVLWWVMAIAFINGILIVFHSFVLSSRYVIAFSFTLLIFAAFGLASLIKQAKTNVQQTEQNAMTKRGIKHRIMQVYLVLSLLIICGFFIKNIATKRSDYSYDKQAAEWVMQQAPLGSRIHFDGGTMRYYAHMPWAGREDNEQLAGLITDLNSGKQRFDYLVMRVKANKPSKLEQLRALKEYNEFKQFCYKSGNCIVVFKHRN